MPPPLMLSLAVALALLAGDLAPTGTLRAVFIADNPVQGRVDPQTGAVTGVAADLVQELARRLRVPSTIVPVADAAAVIDSVKSRKADIGFLAFEAGRATQVDFSNAYASVASAYAVPIDSSIKTSADVDRSNVKLGAVKGQSQEIWVSANLKKALIEALPVMPADDVLARMLMTGQFDVFAANRQRMANIARIQPGVRVLPDNFMTLNQAIVVDKGSPNLEEINRFLEELRESGFVKASLERAQLTGVEVVPVPSRR